MFQYASLTTALAAGHCWVTANSKHPTRILPYYLLHLLLSNSLYVRKKSALHLNKLDIQLSCFSLIESIYVTMSILLDKNKEKNTTAFHFKLKSFIKLDRDFQEHLAIGLT